jgi:tight adherence protein B
MLLYYLAGAGLCIGVGWLFYRSLPVSFLLCVLPFVFREKYLYYRREKKREEVNVQFRDVLYAFSDSAASGRQAAFAIRSARQNLERIYGTRNYLTCAFTDMDRRIRETNDSPERILMDFSADCGIEDIRNFMEIYCICIRSGGDREKAIDKAARIIGEKIGLRQELLSILSQKKLEAAILCSITPLILFFLQMTSSDYADVLYMTLAGRLVMTLCLIAAGAATLMCLRIMDIKI